MYVLGDRFKRQKKTDSIFLVKTATSEIELLSEAVCFNTLCNIEKEDLYSGSRKKAISEAKSLFCYWCVRELGESMTGMAKLLGLTQPAVGYAIERGK